VRGWLLDAFAAAGLYDVGSELFPYLAYEPVSASCELADEGPVAPCAGLQCTADGEVEGDAVYAGRGTIEELESARRAGVDVRGRIAVVHGGLIATVAPGLVESGAIGIVNICETLGGLAGHFTASFYPPPLESPWEGRVLPIPGVTVEAEAGLRLVHAIASGRHRLRVAHRARYEDGETANVVGRLPGSAPEYGEVVVGAHYDTQLESPGASDNGTGLAALLELARLFRRRSSTRSIAFVAFAGEELAAWGAYAYVLRHLRDERRMIAMVNLDALGAPLDATRTIVADAAIAAEAADSARQVGWDAEVTLEAGEFPYADHIPFVDAGVPACWIWRYPPNHPYYHTAGDVLRHVDLGRLTHDTAAAAAAIARFVDRDFDPGPARPTPRSELFLGAIPRAS
jgi:Peptidase family M28